MPRDHKSGVENQLLPHNQEAEQGLLGCLLINGKSYDSIHLITQAEHFFIPAHQRIFAAISEAASQAKSFTPISLKNQFEGDHDLESLGGAAYLFELAGNIVSAFNAEEYALTLKDLWQRRELINGAQEIILKSRNYALSDRGHALADAEKLITSLSDMRASTSYTAAQAVEKSRRWSKDLREGKITQFLTGLPSLDSRIGGLYAGRLYILAARPGMGKTALGLNIADNIALHNPAVFMSLEMPAEEIGMRLDASRTGIPMSKLQTGTEFDMVEEDALRDSMREVILRNLTIEDTSGVDIHGVKSIARRFKRKYGKFVLIIDYLGLITPDHEIRNRVHQIEDITTNLKRLAKELEIPIVLLSQLSRALEGREDKRPGLSDLRDSGSIEQDADVVIFIYREEYYESRSKPAQGPKENAQKFQDRLDEWEKKLYESKGKAELIIAKNRQGKSGRVIVNFSGHSQRFFE